MKKITTILIVTILISLLISCNKNTKNEKTYSNNDDNYSSSISKEYQIESIIDTFSNLRYTIDFDKIIHTKNQLILEYIINDIYKKDSLFFIKIQTIALENHLHFDLEISKKYINIIKDNNQFIIDESPIIVNLESVEKVDFIIEPENGEYMIDLALSTNEYFILKGKVINIIN